jgi:hypothetical protein
MKSWRALKARFWDEQHVGFVAEDMFLSPGRMEAPPLRRFARWLWKQWHDHPAAWIAALCAVIGAIALLGK